MEGRCRLRLSPHASPFRMITDSTLRALGDLRTRIASTWSLL
jgi:hypothetical protein